MRTLSCGILALFLLVSALATRPAIAQKSLADGVDDLASKLAASYGKAKKGKVAILPFRPLEGGENLLGIYLADSLTNSFFNVGYRDIVERQMLDRAMKELKLQYTGMIDPESAKKIGKFLHANLVVGGTLSDLLGKVEVTCRIFAVETGEIVAVAKTELLKDDNVKAMMGRKTGSAGGNLGLRSENNAAGEPIPSTVFPSSTPWEPPSGNASKITDDDWTGIIVDIKRTSIYIDAGSQQGMEPQVKLSVFSLQGVVKDARGRILGEDLRGIGTLNVVSVERNFSIAHILDGCKAIKIMDRVKLAAKPKSPPVQ